MAENEGRIALAIQAYQRGQFLYFKTACNAYNAPYTTACKRVAGVPARRDSPPKSRKLTDLEEQTLEQWILAMISRGLPVGILSIRVMANLLLSKRAGAEVVVVVVVGQKWVYNYIQRHNTLQSKYTRKYDYQRALCEDVTIIRAWFNLVRNTVAKYGILEEDTTLTRRGFRWE
jgi:Tc5 transposase DNA-binding domain